MITFLQNVIFVHDIIHLNYIARNEEKQQSKLESASLNKSHLKWCIFVIERFPPAPFIWFRREGRWWNFTLSSAWNSLAFDFIQSIELFTCIEIPFYIFILVSGSLILFDSLNWKSQPSPQYSHTFTRIKASSHIVWHIHTLTCKPNLLET